MGGQVQDRKASEKLKNSSKATADETNIDETNVEPTDLQVEIPTLIEEAAQELQAEIPASSY